MKKLVAIFLLVSVLLAIDDYRIRRAEQSARALASSYRIALNYSEQDLQQKKLEAEKCQAWAAHAVASGRWQEGSKP